MKNNYYHIYYTILYFLFQVTNVCNPSDYYDCYDAKDYNMSSLPLDCTNDKHLNMTVTCFHTTFNPVVAFAIAGGILKAIPSVIFSTLTYAYLKLHTQVHKKFPMNKAIHHVGPIILAEIILIGGGIAGLISIKSIEPLNSAIFAVVNPIDRMKRIFGVSIYFLVVSFLWCMHPQTKSPIRYQNSQWKKQATITHQIKKTQKKIAQSKHEDNESSEEVELMSKDSVITPII